MRGEASRALYKMPNDYSDIRSGRYGNCSVLAMANASRTPPAPTAWARVVSHKPAAAALEGLPGYSKCPRPFRDRDSSSEPARAGASSLRRAVQLSPCSSNALPRDQPQPLPGVNWPPG
jgi:hypothetical protein